MKDVSFLELVASVRQVGRVRRGESGLLGPQRNEPLVSHAMLQTRALTPADFDLVTPVVDHWWGGRPVRHLLPLLFFEHFGSTSFVVTDGAVLVAFLVGFRSQSQPAVAYIHFVGVAPGYRGAGVARQLYERFFSIARELGCSEVHGITSPANAGSIAFHRRLGFSVLDGNGEVEGVPVTLDYAGPGHHRVQFRRSLEDGAGAA
jgi:ribosomal protein S18 acetylase RimI-like enzyme